MTILQSDLDALNRAIADGVRQVTIGPETITYNTTASLIQARDDLRREMVAQNAKAAGKVAPMQTKLFYAGRGY